MDILKLLRYNRWANALIASQLNRFPSEFYQRDFGGSFGTLHATIAHVVQADSIWLSRFREVGTSNVTDWKTLPTKQLLEEWQRIQDELVSSAGRFSNEPQRQIQFRTRKGELMEMAVDDIVAHVSLHGSYHRGQIANMIRMGGEQPVGTDYFLFANQR